MTGSLYADMHCHSTASDGSLAPAAVARLAAQQGVWALALTDHDTVAGLEEAAAEAGRLGITFLNGIEISCEIAAPATLHLLGYGVDPQSEELRGLTQRLIGAREERNPRMIARLREAGVAVSMEEWEAEANGSVVGRPHLAQILVRRGYCNSVKAAFDKYLGQGGLAYLDKERLPAREAMALIHSAGGICVLAHPSQLRCENDGQLETMVKNLVDSGLGGIEVLHSDHDARLAARCEQLAGEYGLLMTGGSDFHGASKKHITLGFSGGSRRIPRAYFDAVVAALPAAKGQRNA